MKYQTIDKKRSDAKLGILKNATIRTSNKGIVQDRISWDWQVEQIAKQMREEQHND